MSDSIQATFDGLNPAQRERLALLAEELGEAVQIIGKVLRHGYESYNPVAVGSATHLTNRDYLENELGDVRFAIALLCENGDLDLGAIHDAAERKRKRVGKWLHHNEVSA